MAALPLGVFVTGALAFDRVMAPAGEPVSGPVAQVARDRPLARDLSMTRDLTAARDVSVARDKPMSWRDDRSLLEVPGKAPQQRENASATSAPTRAGEPGLRPRFANAPSRVFARTAVTPLPIALQSSAGVPTGSRVIVRGVPNAATLTRGLAIGPDAWLVEATEIGELGLEVHTPTSGEYVLGLQWLTARGELLAEDKLKIDVQLAPDLDFVPLPSVIGTSATIEMPRSDELNQPGLTPPARSRAQSATSAAARTAIESGTTVKDKTAPAERLEAVKQGLGAPSVAAAAAKALTRGDTGIETSATVRPADEHGDLKQADPKQAEVALARGRRMLEIGNIAVGRPLLERAALAGSAAAAMLVAGTYDQEWLQASGAVGVAADPAKARHWYEEASRLGSVEAAKHLSGFAAN